MPQFHLIAPSGYCINQEAAQRGVQRLLEMGHQVENQTIIPAACSVLPVRRRRDERYQQPGDAGR